MMIDHVMLPGNVFRRFGDFDFQGEAGAVLFSTDLNVHAR